MGTTIRPELSEKNPYWIEKHRYYELKHFCLQYPIWRKTYSALDGLTNRSTDLAMFVATNTVERSDCQVCHGKGILFRKDQYGSKSRRGNQSRISTLYFKGNNRGVVLRYFES